MGFIFLLGSGLFGVGLVRRILPWSTVAERLFWGITTGIVISIWAVYVLGRGASELQLTSIVIISILMLGCSGYLWWNQPPAFDRRSIKESLLENIPLLTLISFFLPVFIYIFSIGMFREQGDGWYLAADFYDMVLHLLIASSFSFGKNFPPSYLLMSGEPMRYPFLADFHASIFLTTGWEIWSSFAITGILLSFTLAGTFYCFAKRISKSGWAAFYSGLIFLLNGGFGFVFFLRDWYSGNRSLYESFFNLKEDYTAWEKHGLSWANIIPTVMVPQRTMLYGLPIGFTVLALIAIYWFSTEEEDRTKETKIDPRLILGFAGVLTGLLPSFNMHSYMSIGIIAGILYLLRCRKEWIYFILPSVILAIPQVFSLEGTFGSSSFFHLQLGWKSHLVNNNVPYFILLNFGLPIVLIFPALFFSQRSVRLFYIPFLALFVICFVFRISPNDSDNSKLLFFWYAATAVVVGSWLHRALSKPIFTPLLLLILLTCTFAGILSTKRNSALIWRIFSPEEIEAGKFVRDRVEPKARFLTGQYHNQPALCIGGRPLILGHDYWIWSHGYSREYIDSIKREIPRMYSGGPESPGLLRKFGVDYIFIGPKERDEFKPNEGYFTANYEQVFKNASISIYKIPKQE